MIRRLSNKSTLGCIGDVHLLHNRNPTAKIATNLRQFLIPRIKDMAYLQLNGDWYDKSGIMSEHDVPIAADVIMEILQECDKHNVVLRILEGTASHDRGQLAMAETWHKRWGLKNDIRYINKITIETITGLGMTVLHIPDNLPFASSDLVCDHIADLMSQMGIRYIDYAFCHGYFDYTVGHGAHAPRMCFRPEQFTFVKHHVLCSHVHTAGPDRTGKIMYTKSFDRLAHGEEDPKGFLIVDDFDTSPKVKFIENTNAMPFITINMDDPASVCIEIFKNMLDMRFGDAPHIGFVRLIHPDVIARKAIKEWVSNQRPLVVFSDMSPDDVPATVVCDDTVSDQPLVSLPTEEQLPQVLFDLFGGEYSLEDIKRCMGVT